jgi:PAS domain S-box-containing protein
MGSTWTDRVSRGTMQYGMKPLAIACFFVLVAHLWTLLFQHVIAYPFLFLFFGAVMGAAWFGGIISGFIAVALSTILVDYFLVPPLFSMSVAPPSRSFMVAFVVCACAMSLVSSARRRGENSIRDARDQLETKLLTGAAELKHSFLQLRESERRLRSLSEAIPQQMWSADAHGSIYYCNQHLLNYVGGAKERMLGETFFSVLHPVDEPLLRKTWRAAMDAETVFESETRIRGADGIYRWFLIRGLPQFTEAGTLVQWYGIHIDIEQLHRAQQGLTFAHDELSRLSRTTSMGELAASIAHELNQPLTAVVTHAYACREWLHSTPPNTEKATATAEKIVQESTRASAVVARVRAMFRKDAHFREPTDLNRLIQELIPLVRDEAVRRNVSIRVELALDLPSVEADPVQMQQVLLNLVMNGMDAMQETAGPRELIIRSERRGAEEVLIAVEDRGVGLTAEIAARMFQPFFSTKPEGTGMGLAICRSIIEAHDGHIWAVEPEQGGAIFQFTLRVRP